MLNKEENDSQLSNNEHIQLKNHLFQCLPCCSVTRAHGCGAFSWHMDILGFQGKTGSERLWQSPEGSTNSGVGLGLQSLCFPS